MGDKETEILVPLINDKTEEDPGGERAETRRRRWWQWDREEAREQILLSLPMIVTNVCYYFIPLVSVMFAGHNGDAKLAAANLANSWAYVTGFALMIGLSGALETLCGQGYGAKLYKMLGIHLQASCIISFVFTVLVSILWWHSDIVFLMLHQDPYISKAACLYLKHLIPGLFAFGFLQNILRFLQMQSVVFPLVLCSLVTLVFHIGITYVLVHWTFLGFKGAALAASTSLWISVLTLVAYVLSSRRFEHTLSGFSSESFRFVFANLKLALPSAAMVCLEEWASELLVLLAGLLPNSKLNTSLIAMCVNTQGICYMFAFGLGSTASKRVSNELGARNPERARHAMTVALKLTFFLALAVVLAMAFGHNIWARFFSDSDIIKQAFSTMRPFLVMSISFDFLQGILSGVTRGCGWQHLGLWINLATFYLIGMPVSLLLSFWLKLYAKGLWIGLICGLSSQTLCLLLLTKFTKWTSINLSSHSATHAVSQGNDV